MQMLHSFHQRPVMPVYLVEAHYDQENVGHPPDYGTPSTLRREEYWTMLTGGTGQFYGNFYTWSFSPGWQHYVDTWGVKQLTIWKDFFSSLPWYDLVPDETHSVVTSGVGSYGDFKTRVSQSDFCTAARTSDGAVVVIYMPTARTITVDMTNFNGPSKAEWFDPTNGTRTRLPGAFPDTGERQFTPPGKNHDGDSDWVLLLSPSQP
jgi:hypothetical protein